MSSDEDFFGVVLYTTLMLTNFWWALPSWLTDMVQPKNKQQITFTAYKAEDGKWFFNKPLLLTWKESLVFTEALDELAGALQISTPV